MQKSMHFFQVRAFKQIDDDQGNKLPAQQVNLSEIFEQIYTQTNLNRDLSTLRKKIKQRDLALTIYYSDGNIYKGRFCIIKEGPLSEGVLTLDDGSEEIGYVYAQDNTRLLFGTVAFVYRADINKIGLSMKCNSMLEDYLNAYNMQQDFGVDEIGITQDEAVFGTDSLSETEAINSILIEILASKAKEVEGDSWLADYVRSLGNLDREALLSVKIVPEVTAGGEIMLITKQSIGDFWNVNNHRMTSLEINPDRKGGFKFGVQNHVKKFDAKKDGDVLNTAELNDRAIEYLLR